MTLLDFGKVCEGDGYPIGAICDAYHYRVRHLPDGATLVELNEVLPVKVIGPCRSVVGPPLTAEADGGDARRDLQRRMRVYGHACELLAPAGMFAAKYPVGATCHVRLSDLRLRELP